MRNDWDVPWTLHNLNIISDVMKAFHQQQSFFLSRFGHIEEMEWNTFIESQVLNECYIW